MDDYVMERLSWQVTTKTRHGTMIKKKRDTGWQQKMRHETAKNSTMVVNKKQNMEWQQKLEHRATMKKEDMQQ